MNFPRDWTRTGHVSHLEADEEGERHCDDHYDPRQYDQNVAACRRVPLSAVVRCNNATIRRLFN